MPITRAPSGPRLLSWSISSSLRRCYSSTTRSSPNTSKSSSPSKYTRSPPSTAAPSPRNYRQPPKQTQRQGPRSPRFFIPAEAQDYVQQSGRMSTTPEVWSFLQETGIEYNNSKAPYLDMGNDSSMIKHQFGCDVQYSPQYILHPYNLQYLKPAGHPILPALMRKYRRSVEEKPLWFYVMNKANTSSIVRTTIIRRLTGAFWKAMEGLASTNGMPRGTVIVVLSKPEQASHLPAHLFGEAVGKAVAKKWQWHLKERKKKPTQNDTQR